MIAHASGMNLSQAINAALSTALEDNPDVVVIGQDVGEFGGVFRATVDLFDRFGPARIIDAPLNEAGIVGTAIGMGLFGLRPVAELHFADNVYPAFDHIANELARLRYRSGGELSCPVTLRLPFGAGVGGGLYRSQSPEAHFAHIPGLRVVCPSTAGDARAMLLAAIDSDDPVVFLEPKALYRRGVGQVDPEHDDPFCLTTARQVRAGDDVTVVAWGAMVDVCVQAASRLAADGIECAVIDLRCLAPLDLDPVVDSVRQTGRLVVVHEAPQNVGVGAEVAARVQRDAFLSLEAPIGRVAGYDLPVSRALEDAYLPSPARVAEAVEATIHY